MDEIKAQETLGKQKKMNNSFPENIKVKMSKRIFYIDVDQMETYKFIDLMRKKLKENDFS